MRLWPASSPDFPGRVTTSILVATGLVVGFAAEQEAFDWEDPRRWVPDLVVGLTFIGAGVAAMPRRTGTAWLLAATGFCWFLGNFMGVLQYAHRGPLVHVLVAYVGWRARTRIEMVAVIAGYVAAVVAPIWRNDVAAVVLSSFLIAVVAYGWSAATGRARSERLVALRATVVLAIAVSSYVVVTRAVPSGDAVEPMLLVYEVALCIVAITLAAGLVTPSASAVADLVVELGESRSGSLREALAEAVSDPTLKIGYWSPSGEYRDASGRSVVIPGVGGDRVATFVEQGSRPFAVLVHDASVLDEPALVDAVAAATRLTEANAALLAEVRAQLAGVAASRRRLVLAADEARRQLAARVHDGVERRITGLTEEVRELAGADGAAEHIERAGRHLAQTVGDLRDLAHGLHPRELDTGLPTAIGALAERCSVPVDVTVEAGSGAAGETAVAVYYICAEALANVAKHAAASRVGLEVAERSGWLHVDVTDDGIGCADPSRGSGLRGLIDRVEALGGTLTVSSPAAGGTRLAAELPLGRQA